MNVKEILKDLVKFNTIQDKENSKIIDYIENCLKEIGFITKYKTKCLVMQINNECNLGFLGHTDTVQAGNDWSINPFNMKVEDGKIYGLGTCDMKSGIAAIIKAVSEIDWKKQKYGMKLYFTYDEEINFEGIKELIKVEKNFPKNMIIGEPTDNLVMNASKGLLELKLIFSGISAHSSMPDKGENAIEKCMECLMELKDFYNSLKCKLNKSFEIPYTTMNIGKIYGGKSINIVPNSCEILIDFRTIDVLHTKLILDKIDKLMKKYNGKYEVINNIQPFMNEKENLCPTDFITEASFLNVENRYILGAGPINAHKKDEYISEKSLDKLVEQYKEYILKNCGELFLGTPSKKSLIKI